MGSSVDPFRRHGWFAKSPSWNSGGGFSGKGGARRHRVVVRRPIRAENLRAAFFRAVVGYPKARRLRPPVVPGSVSVVVDDHCKSILLAQNGSVQPPDPERVRAVLQALSALTSDLIYALDLEGRYTHVSEAAARVLNLTPDEMIGRTWSEIGLPPERQQEFFQERREVIATGKPHERVVEFPTPSGAALFDYRIAPIHADSGEVIGTLTLSRDITAEMMRGRELESQVLANQRVTERLKREEERYRTLVTASSEAVWSASPNGELLTDIPMWRAITGQTVEGLLGTGWLEAIADEDRERVAQIWGRAVASLAPYEAEYRIRTRDGGIRWIFARGYPLRDSDGAVREWIGTAADVTQRKRDEDAATFLADASAVLASSLEMRQVFNRIATLAVPRLADWCAIDFPVDDGPYERAVVLHSNPDLVRLVHELDRDYRVLPEVDPIVAVHREQKSMLVERLDAAYLDSIARDDHHRRIIRQLGLRSWIIVPILDRGRTVASLTLVQAESGRSFDERDLRSIEDLAQRAGMAVQNAKLFEAAQSANVAKDEFLATLSHELRTPMTSILGWSRLMKMGERSEEILTDAIDAIERSASAQAQLIEDLLDVSRITSGKLLLNIERTNVGKIAAAVASGILPTAEAKKIEMTLHVGDSIPEVAADSSRMQQVLWNLVSNAVKFTPQGGRVSVEVGSSEGNLLICVKDTGEGIDAAVLPHIFERFRQADSSPTRRYGGLGLGLAIAREIIELHGGAIRAESEGRGKGASFQVVIPVVAPDFEGSVRAGTSAVRSRGEAGDLEGIDIVLVEDEPNTRLLIATTLQRSGANVRVATSADEAVHEIRRRIPDVLVSDLGMPKRDGFDLISEVRGILRIEPSRMPAIALTAFGQPEDRERVLASGFQRFLLKPFDPPALTRAIAELRQEPASRLAG